MCVCVCAQLLSYLLLVVTLLIAAETAPLTMEFSQQEYWSGLPFPTPGIILVIIEIITGAAITLLTV